MGRVEERGHVGALIMGGTLRPCGARHQKKNPVRTPGSRETAGGGRDYFFAQVSFSVIVRLNTSLPGALSFGSSEK